MMAQLVESGKLTLDDIRELEKAVAETERQRKAERQTNEMMAEFIVNHLWQSSCFVLLAGLLAFVLRKNSPKVRYWVWLSASLKFLVPFALMVSLGSAIKRPAQRVVAFPSPVFSSIVVEMAEPFTPPSYSTLPAHASVHWVPIVIGIAWALGFVAIAVVRCRSWFRIRATLRTGTPIELPIPIPACRHACRGGARHRRFSAAGISFAGWT